LRFGIIADAHLGPAGTRVPSFHIEYEMAETMVAYRLALRQCVRENADGILVPGDLSHSGDDESLEVGVRIAAETGLPVWVVSGNHDSFERMDALAEAVRQVGADNVHLATPVGEEFGASGLRVAGFSVASGNWGYAAGPEGRPDVSSWKDEPVVWLTHYPMLSFADEVSRTDLIYGDDLEDLEEVAQPLLERSGPTVVVSGHVHLRSTRVKGKVLQIACSAFIEPPFEITFLDLEREGDKIVIRTESVPLVPSLTFRLPAFSPSQQEWIFEAGAWRPVGSADSGRERSARTA
jgi:predicted phosphodiesterase